MRPLAAALALGLLVTVAWPGAASGAGACTGDVLYGITATRTPTRFVTFPVDDPAAVTVQTLGVQGPIFKGIDVRPATGEVYAFTEGGMYVVDPATAEATLRAVFAGPAGDKHGFDFDPATDTVRVVTNRDGNVAFDPDTGAVVEVGEPVHYAGDDPNAGVNPRLVAIAYDRSRAGAPLYGIDMEEGDVNDRLVRVRPPEAGRLLTVAQRLPVSIGSLRVGFDVGADGDAYVSARDVVSRVDLATGAVQRIGSAGVASLTGVTVGCSA